MNEELKLEERNVENTHPSELKRMQRKEVEDCINVYRKKIEFSLINFSLFLFIIFMILKNSEIVNPYFSIIPAIISIIFLIKIFVDKDNLKFERIKKNGLELFYKEFKL